MSYVKAYENTKPVSGKTKTILKNIEEQRKIASMNLFELKELACPKALQKDKSWYMTCVSCAGIDTCSIGRRVIEILENETKPEEKKQMDPIAKFNHRIQSGDVRGSNIKYALVGRDACIEALKQPDPIEYIVKMNGCLRSSAISRLKRWKERWPELFKNAIKREDVSKVTSDILNDKNLKTSYNIGLQEKCKNHIRAAFAYPEGVFAYYSKVLNITTRSAIRAKLKNYVIKYPDLEQELHISEWLKANRGIPGKHITDEEPEEVMVHMTAPVKKEPIEDEVSVEDFLSEMTEEKPVEKIAEEKPVEKNLEVKSSPVKAEATIQDAALLKGITSEWLNIEKKEAEEKKADEEPDMRAACLAFSKKRKEILRDIDVKGFELEALEKKAAIIRKDISELKDKLSKLDDAAYIMGFKVEEPHTICNSKYRPDDWDDWRPELSSQFLK